MSDRDVKKIWEAVIRERDHLDYEPHPVPDPGEKWYHVSNRWKAIVGLDTRDVKPIAVSDISKMIEYFKTLPGTGREDDYMVVLDELRKLNEMNEYDGPQYAKKLGFDGSFDREDFETIYDHLVIHINKSAANRYLEGEFDAER